MSDEYLGISLAIAGAMAAVLGAIWLFGGFSGAT